MRPLAINFVSARKRPSALALLVFALGAAALVASAQDFLDARDALALEQEQSARLPRKTPNNSARALPRVASEEAQQVVRIAGELQVPWDAMLRDLEARASQSVALISVSVQGPARTLRITGEAAAMPDVVQYVTRLRESEILSSVYLSSQEERKVGAARVIRFSLDANWGKTL
jgi:Tfp pilus assembly protein PilN